MAGVPAARPMDWGPGGNPPSSSGLPAYRPAEAGQQFMGPNSQQYRMGAPPMSSQPMYPPPMQQMPMRPAQQPPISMPFNQQQRPVMGQPPPQPGVQYPFPQQGNAYPASYQVGNQGQPYQSYPLNAGPTNNAPGMPQGLQSGVPGSAPGSAGRASDWQEHVAPDGRRYYHNKRTKQSSWEKPDELMSPTERADASTIWKEVTTADGKKYYYNKMTNKSTWTMPEEMRMAREQAERMSGNILAPKPEATPAVPSPLVSSPVASLSPAMPATSVPQAQTPPVSNVASTITATTSPAPAAVNAEESVKMDVVEEASAQDIEDAKKAMASTAKVNVTPAPDEKPVPVEEQFLYPSKTEAKTAFKELLESVHVQSDWTWDQTMRMIINDKRYGALKTLGERKQAFNEYLAQRKKQDLEEKRLKQKKAREEFVKMLEESKELTSSMRWSKVISMFENDPRFHAVEKEREREDLFDDYLLDLERKEREKAREEKKKNRADFRAFLESCDFIKVNTQWRKVQDRLEDDERCTRLEKLDRLEVFQEYIRDLEKEEEEEKKMQKEQQRRKERKNRDEYRNLMDVHKAAGTLNARTQWRDYLSKVKEHPAYQAVAMNTSGSTPKDLFMDVIEELEKQYHEDKARIKDIMKAGKITVVASSTFEKFKAAIAEAGDLATIAETNLKLVFEDAIERIKEKEEKEVKRRRRLADDFNALLRSTKSLTAASKWEDSKSLFEESAEYRAVADESVLKKLFDEHIAYLQQKTKEKERKREKDDKSKKEKDKEKDKEKEKEREKDKEEKDKEKDRDKDKEKERDRRKDKEREKEKSSSRKDKETNEEGEAVHKEEKKKDKDKERDREKDKDKKHKKRHRSGSSDDGLSDKDERDESRKSRKHGHDHKKSSRKHGHESDSDTESKHKRHKREREGRRNGAVPEELEDGEVGEDGEIR